MKTFEERFEEFVTPLNKEAKEFVLDFFAKNPSVVITNLEPFKRIEKWGVVCEDGDCLNWVFWSDYIQIATHIQKNYTFQS